MSPVGGVSEIKALLGMGSTDSRAIHFGANESKEDRMRRIEEITKGNPNVKLSPEAFQKLMQGGEVDVTLNLDAPERRNLFIGAFATLAQMGGAAGGAAYNKDLGDAVTSRVSGDAQFVAKHGNNYKMNLFGGAEAQTGSIQVGDPVFDPTLSNDDITTDQIKENLAAQATGATRQISRPDDTPMARAIQARFLAKFGYTEQEMSGKGQSTQDGTKGNAITRSMFNGEYGKNAVDQGRKGVIASIHIYGKNKLGGDINYLAGADLDGVANKEKIMEARIKAAQDYLKLGVSSGLMTQAEVDAAGKDPEQLKNKFKDLEVKLKAKYGDESKTVLDGFLGDHHIMAMQRAISDKLQGNQELAFGINEIANGESASFTTKQKEEVLKLAGMSDSDIKKIGGVDKAFTDFAERLQKREGPAVNQAITALDGVTRAQKDLLFGKGGDNNNITGGLLGTAHGIYATHNTFLAQNIVSTGLVDPSQFKGELKKALGNAKLVDDLISGPNKGTSFDAQIENLKAHLLAPAQATTQTTGQVTLTIDGKSESGSVEKQAERLTPDVIASMKPEDRVALIPVLKQAIEAARRDGTEAKPEGKTDSKVDEVIAQLGSSKPSSISTENQAIIAGNIKKVEGFLSKAGNNTPEQIAKASTAIGEISDQMKKAGLDPEKDPAFASLKASLGAARSQTNAGAVGAAKSAQPSDPLLAQFSNVRKSGTEIGVDPKVKKMLSDGYKPEAIAEKLNMDVSAVEAEKGKLDTSIKKMFGEGFSLDFISKVTGVSSDYVEKVKDESTPIGKKILEALPELSTRIAAGFFDLADQILDRLNKEAAGSFEYGFGHGNGGRITSKIGGAADQDKKEDGNGKLSLNVSSQAFETGLKAGNGLKSGFDLIKQYGKNRELEANEDKISVREGVRRYNDNISKYIAGSTPTDQAETIKKHSINYPMTSDTKTEPTKYGQQDGLSVPTVSDIKPANDTDVDKAAKLKQVTT